MQQKLPENIDKLDSFYQEQFKDFAPEVSDSVWESIHNNIPKSASVGTSVSTGYLLKVVGIMLSGIIGIAVVTDSFDKTPTTKPLKQEKEITPTTPVTIEEIEKNTPEVENPVVNENETTQPQKSTKVTVDKSITIEKKAAKEVKKQPEDSIQKKQEQSDFQFVEELKFE